MSTMPLSKSEGFVGSKKSEAGGAAALLSLKLNSERIPIRHWPLIRSRLTKKMDVRLSHWNNYVIGEVARGNHGHS